VNLSDASSDIRMAGIQPGTLFVAEGTRMPEAMGLEGAPDSNGWKSVGNVDRSEFERKISRAGWIFFLRTDEIKATVFGFDRERALRVAMQRIIARVKFQRCNSLQIKDVTAKSFLKVPYVSVTAHSRHIQERPSFDGQ